MSGPQITCPVCSRVKIHLEHNGSGQKHCPCSKKKRLQFHRFPAYVRDPVPKSAQNAGFVEGESTCFHHPDRKAVAACADCGIFICDLCEVKDKEESLCLSCFAKRQQKELKSESYHQGSKRLVHDNLALSLAAFPLLFFWFSILTAPAALFVVIRYWNRHPCSVVPRTRLRFLVAGVLAVAQIVAWTFFLIAFMENTI